MVREEKVPVNVEGNRAGTVEVLGPLVEVVVSRSDGVSGSGCKGS